MINFVGFLGRYEAFKFNQLEAAELLGVGERTFRRCCQRYEEDGEAGTGGWARPPAGGFRLTVQTRWKRFTARATPALRRSIFTSIW